MLGNYLIIALRNLLRNKLFSLINILGLAVGLASCLVCYLHLSYELGYDNFHEHESEIYRVITGNVAENDYWVMMAAPIPPVLKAEFPEVEDYCRMAFLSWDPKVSVRSDRQVFNEQNFFLVDPSFLSVFSFKLLKGDPSTALPQTTVWLSLNRTQKNISGMWTRLER